MLWGGGQLSRQVPRRGRRKAACADRHVLIAVWSVSCAASPRAMRSHAVRALSPGHLACGLRVRDRLRRTRAGTGRASRRQTIACTERADASVANRVTPTVTLTWPWNQASEHESTMSLAAVNRLVEAVCTLVRTLKPVGTHRSRPEPAVTTGLSRIPPDVCRDSGMRYHSTTIIWGVECEIPLNAVVFTRPHVRGALMGALISVRCQTLLATWAHRRGMTRCGV
jgi:hypothetical protein